MDNSTLTDSWPSVEKCEVHTLDSMDTIDPHVTARPSNRLGKSMLGATLAVAGMCAVMDNICYSCEGSTGRQRVKKPKSKKTKANRKANKSARKSRKRNK